MKAPHQFVVCIRNEGQEASLELRKIYEMVDDPEAAKLNMLRVIDEEAEGYLYPKDWFLPIELPHKLEAAIVELVEQ